MVSLVNVYLACIVHLLLHCFILLTFRQIATLKKKFEEVFKPNEYNKMDKYHYFANVYAS